MKKRRLNFDGLRHNQCEARLKKAAATNAGRPAVKRGRYKGKCDGYRQDVRMPTLIVGKI